MRLVSFVLLFIVATTCPGADLYWNGQDQSDYVGKGRVLFAKDPVLVATGVAEVASGTASLIWRDNAGIVWGRGKNNYELIENTDSSLVENTLQITTGATKLLPCIDDSLFLLKASGLWTRGQDRVSIPSPSYSALPALTLVSPDYVQISPATGTAFYVALKADGTAWAVGANDAGQLGNGSTVAGQNQVGTNAVKVGVTSTGGFVLRADHTLWFFGTSFRGVNGTGADVTNQVPTIVMSGVADFTTDRKDGVVVLKQDGTLWAAGENYAYRFRNPADNYVRTFTQIDSGVAQMALWETNLFYLKTDGTLLGLGGNADNVFGTGVTNTAYYEPETIASSVAHFSLDGSLAFVKTDGSVWISGISLVSGFLGTVPQPSGPVKLNGTFTGAKVTVHNFSRLSILMGGNLYACGSNIEQFALASGKVLPTEPELVRKDVVSAEVSNGLFVVTADGNLWNSGPKNLIGIPLFGPGGSTTPELIATGVAQVMAADQDLFFLKTDGSVWGIGFNSGGVLGAPAHVQHITPVLITTNVKKLCPAYFNLLFIKNDNSLWISGYNFYGQYGNGTYESSVPPVQIASDVVDAALGYHLLYVKSDGTVWGAGQSGWGVFNPNGYANVNGMMQLKVMEGAKAVACTNTSSLVLKTNGDLLEFGFSVLSPDANAYSSKTVATSVASISASTYGFAFVKTDGTAWTGGFSYDGGGGKKPPAYDVIPVTQLATGVSSVVSRYGVTLLLKGPNAPTSPATPPTPTSPSTTGRPINLSVRGAAGQGDQTLIAGFTIAGSGTKTVLIRISGPGLAPFLSGYVANPTLKIYDGTQTLVASNDDWDISLKNDFASVGAFAWTDGSKDAAVKLALPPGGYTIHVGNTGAKAEALIEVYDFGKEAGSKLSNVSCRVLENPTDPVIVGVTLDKSAKLLARNGGPSLKALGVTTAADDTHLVAFNSDKSELARNDDFDPSLSSTFSSVGAYSYGSTGKDAALLLEAAPTSFTLHCSSKGSSGIGLCEVYLVE